METFLTEVHAQEDNGTGHPTHPVVGRVERRNAENQA